METKTAAMSDATVRQMISLLKDPVFCGLRVLADERPLTREEFEMLARPEGVSREQARELAERVRAIVRHDVDEPGGTSEGIGDRGPGTSDLAH